MTQQHGETLAPQVPDGPPWSLDAVADVHAGVFPPEVQRRLLAEMAADPEASAMLAALGGVVDELSLLPPLPMPEQYAARLDAAIAAEAAARAGSAPVGPPRPLTVVPPPGPAPQPPAPQPPPQQHWPAQQPAAGGQVVSLDAVRARRRRSWVTGIGLAAAVAAVATVVVVAVKPNASSGGSAQVAPPQLTSSSTSAPPNAAGNTEAEAAPTNGVAPNVVVIDPDNLQQAFKKVQGHSSGKMMSNPVDYAGCLARLDINGELVLGVTDVRYQGKTAIAWALSIPGDSRHAELVVVAAGCGPNGAQVLLRQQVDL